MEVHLCAQGVIDEISDSHVPIGVHFAVNNFIGIAKFLNYLGVVLAEVHQIDSFIHLTGRRGGIGFAD